MKQAVIISYNCCGAVFHAAVVPDSYEDAEFMRELKKYAKHPDKYTIKTVPLGDFKFGKCECVKSKKLPQLLLF